MNYKRKKRKIKTVNGYLPGDGPIGNSKKDQTRGEQVLDEKKFSEFMELFCNYLRKDEFTGEYID